MIKDVEVVMVHAATYALEAGDRNPGAGVEDIIKHFLKDSSSDIKPELKIYSVAAINSILKLKANRENKGANNKQLMQLFMKNIKEISREIEQEEN